MIASGSQVFVEFGKSISNYAAGLENGMSTTEQGTDGPVWLKNIVDTYSKSHMYNVDESTKKLLLLTKPPKGTTIQHLPHKEMFVAVEFTKEEISQFTGMEIEYDKIRGLIIQEGDANFISEERQVAMATGTAIRVIVLGNDKDGEVFSTFNLSVDMYEEFKDMESEIVEYAPQKKTKKFAQKFAINLINLILDPEVQLVFREASAERNAKRISKDKVPFPNSTMIRVDGKRKQYIDAMETNGGFEYGYRFWVQGHYRTLKAERYGANVGKKLWIPPFIKGKGILIEKQYEVEI